MGGIESIFDVKRKPEQQFWSYYKEVEFEKLPDVLDQLRNDKVVSLISDAGTPLVSDPGFLLMKQVIRENLSYTVIPGPSAVITALIHAGVNAHNFQFMGFLPKKTGELNKVITQMKTMKEMNKDLAIVFFESAQRMKETLESLNSILPDVQVTISREMTKKFEEIHRGTPAELAKHKGFKGELTVVIQ
jgi:16S rRNA (cytidine1402-2'-O)-methyltransferase